MPMPPITGWSLWLPPVGRPHELLQNQINYLVKSHGGHLFEPHVTLLGTIQGKQDVVAQKTANLTSQVGNIIARVSHIEIGQQYVQAVYLRLTDGPLTDANQLARQIFDRQSDPPFMPHLSLAYGDFDQAVKEQMVAEIGNDYPRSFILDTIDLWSTNGAPENWKKVKSFPLQV